MGNPKGIKRDFEALERRRFRACQYFKEGLRDSEIARKLGVHRSSVGEWRKQWRQVGQSGLKAAGRAGRKPRLDVKQRRAIVSALKKGAQASGYSSDVWTLPRVTALIEQLTGVKYHPGYAGELMRQLGWSCQRPSMRAKERDEASIASWKQHKWPAIKKKPKKSGES